MPNPINLNDPRELQKVDPRIAGILGSGDKQYTKTENPWAPAIPYSYDPTGAENPNQNFERYYSHSSYDKLGFNPWRDNETLYNEQGSKLGDVWRATKSAAKLSWTGFMSPLRSYGDLFSGDALEGDQKSAQEMKYLNDIGMSTRKGVTGFTSNLITNSGYTVGLLGEMVLETAALTYATVQTGGLAAPMLLARLGKGAKDFGKYAEGVEGLNKVAQTLNNYGAAETFWKGSKGIIDFVNPLGNTVEAVKLMNGAKELSVLAKASTTAGGFFRDVQMANLTLSESKLEGASAQNDLESELIADYRRQNDGKWPPEEKLLQIKEAAADAGFKALAWNIPTIFLTNKITFDPLLKSFSKPATFTLKNGLEVIDAGKKGIVEATFKNKALASLNPKNWIKAPLTYFKENLSEGIQESAQEVISGATKDYYKAIYNNAAKQGIDYAKAENEGSSVWDAISTNVVDQFSGKGFETFASGFFMGALIHPISAGVSSIKNFKKDEYKKQKEAYSQATLKKLNEINSNPLTFFGNGILNFSNGAEAVKGQKLSEEEGNQKDWQDFEDQNIISNVLTALDNKSFEIFEEKLKTIKTMTPEAIKEAYGLDGQEVLSKMDKILGRASNIKENYEKWNNRYQNPFDPRKYNKGTTEYTREAIGYSTWENAKKLAVFSESSFERNLERIQNISQNILQTKGFDKIGAMDVSLLFHPDTINTEIGLLQNELEVLSDSEVADKKTISDKRNKLKKLQSFNEKLRGYYLGTVVGEKIGKVSKNQLRKAYEEYVTHLGNSQTEGVSVDRLNLEQTFQQLLDIHNLKQDNLQHAEAINLFANPEGFVDQYKRLNKVFSDLYKNREELNKEAIKNTQTKMEDNAILNVLFERGFVLSPENVEKLLNNKEVPNEFYDQNAKQVINQSDPIRFEDFKRIVTTYTEATASEPVVEVKETKTGPVPVDSEKPAVIRETTGVTADTKKLLEVVSKIDKITGEEDFKRVEAHLAALLENIHIDAYQAAGISVETINEMLDVKNQQLLREVILKNLNRGNIVTLNDKDALGRSKYAKVHSVGKDYVKLESLEFPGLITKVEEKDLKEIIKMKHSEQQHTEKVNPTPQEVENTKQNLAKDAKFIDNNKDVLEKLLEEALKDEARFEQEFVNNLGCK